MFSVGIDLVEIVRIEKAMRHPKFLSRILGESEYLQLQERGFPVQSVAANFCAKEAFVKAIGLGFTNGIKLTDIQLLRAENGKPFLELYGMALSLKQQKNQQYSVSITHTKEYASAVVIAYSFMA